MTWGRRTRLETTRLRLTFTTHLPNLSLPYRKPPLLTILRPTHLSTFVWIYGTTSLNSQLCFARRSTGLSRGRGSASLVFVKDFLELQISPPPHPEGLHFPRKKHINVLSSAAVSLPLDSELQLKHLLFSPVSLPLPLPFSLFLQPSYPVSSSSPVACLETETALARTQTLTRPFLPFLWLLSFAPSLPFPSLPRPLLSSAQGGSQLFILQLLPSFLSQSLPGGNFELSSRGRWISRQKQAEVLSLSSIESDECRWERRAHPQEEEGAKEEVPSRRKSRLLQEEGKGRSMYLSRVSFPSSSLLARFILSTREESNGRRRKHVF